MYHYDKHQYNNFDSNFFEGGYLLGVSFRGCMRNVEVDESPMKLNLISPQHLTNVDVGTCGLTDR